MIRIPKTNPVEFLVERKFPDARKLRIPPPITRSGSSRGTVDSDYRQKRLKEIDDYKAKLHAMPHQELMELFEAEREKDRQERAVKAEEEEKKRFFNLPAAEADFDHWSRATYWTLEEAIALSFGKAPERVDWNRLKKSNYYPPSPFIEKYRKVRDLALRAKNFRQLYDPCLPSIFLAWARRSKIDVPTALVERIQAQGIDIADWKDLYDNLKEKYDSLVKTNSALSQQLEHHKAPISDETKAAQSEYWKKLEQLADKAINAFPAWSQQQRKIQKTGNLKDWLKKDIGADDREAEILKKVLTELFEKLQ